jgi:hypothetical protein
MTESVKTRAPQVAVQFAQNNRPLVIPKRGFSREESAASLLSASRFVADRAGFGITILWGF